MATNMRVKVRVADLLKRVHAAKARAVKEHEKALADYEARVEAWPRVVALALDAAFQGDQQKLGTTEVYARNAYIQHLLVPLPVRAKKPGSKPRLDTARFDKDAALLEMCSDEVLAISTDDRFSRYL